MAEGLVDIAILPHTGDVGLGLGIGPYTRRSENEEEYSQEDTDDATSEGRECCRSSSIMGSTGECITVGADAAGGCDVERVDRSPIMGRSDPDWSVFGEWEPLHAIVLPNKAEACSSSKADREGRKGPFPTDNKQRLIPKSGMVSDRSFHITGVAMSRREILFVDNCCDKFSAVLRLQR